jgi:DNA recombination protein RmuC
MNDLIIQTIIFASITLLSVISVFIYFNKKQSEPNSNNNEIESLKEQLSFKIEELTSIKEDNANIRAELASANSSIQFFSKLEDQHSELELKHENVEQSLSERKVDNSRLSTQVEEKSIRLNQLIDEVSLLTQQISSLQNNNNHLSNDKAELSEKLKSYKEIQAEVRDLKSFVITKNEQITDLKSQLSADHASKIAQHEKIELLERTEQRLVKEFENTANKIFKEKTGEMSAQNKSSLDTLLMPLKNQIGDFSKQVNDVYTNEAKERHALKQEVHSLKALNEQMGKDATALTKALKGDNKK